MRIPLMAAFAVAAAFALAPVAVADEIAGPAALTLSSGLSLHVPAGWRAGGNGAVASMVGPDGDTTVIATLQPASDAVMAAQLRGPIDLGGGIVLTPITAPVSEDDFSMADFSVVGTSKHAQGVVMVKAVAGGRGFALVGLAPVDTVEDMRAALREIMAQSQIGAPVALASPGTDGWAGYMRGRYLVQLYTGNGYQEKHELWFCSDGSFATSMEGGGFTAGVASGAFGSNGNGTWTASGDLSGPGIIEVERGGQSGQFRAELRGDGLYLNGARWLRGDNERCQ